MAEDRLERRLTTILAADVVGYSRLMAADEAGTLTSLKALRRELIEPKTAEYHGRVVKLIGDGTLMEFGSVVDAVHFAVDVQQAMAERNAKVPEDRRITYRIGINIGDIIVEGEDIYGDGVNVAARLEMLAEPGGVCVARNVHSQVEAKVDLAFEDLGEQMVKNIPKPVQVFKVRLDSSATDRVAPIPPAAKWSLRWQVVAGGLVVLVITAGVVLWQRPWEEREEPASVAAIAFPLPDKPSIAVLPFTNMSGDAEQEYFADGMTEDLITDLSKISGLFVIARNSSFSYKDQQVKVRQVAEELGVRYVLEGSVRRSGDEVRINAQLIDATTGGHLWAERYDGTLEDIFDVQDQVTGQIVAALAVSLTGEEESARASHATENTEAHDAYLQGLAHYKLGTPEDLARALPFLEEAVQLDPGYAQAHAVLASLYWNVFKNDWAFDLGMPSSRAESRATEHLDEALKSSTPLAHAVQARMFASFGFPEDAVVEAEMAVALDGNDATALAGLADALIKVDRAAEGLDYIQQAKRLDPHYPPRYLTILGAAQFGMEDFEASAATFERAIKRNPDNELPLIYLASSYGHLGRIKEADNAIEAANDMRQKFALGDLTLERIPEAFTWTPFRGEIDFPGFGGRPVQERVRAGLTDIPAVTWQYRVTTHAGLGAGVTWYEMDGVTEIDIHTAKSLYDDGTVFIDASHPNDWMTEHVPGAVNLTHVRGMGSTVPRFTEETLMAIANKATEVVVYCSGTCIEAAWAAAKAVNWGFEKVYFVVLSFGKLQAWKDAGYPIETGE